MSGGSQTFFGAGQCENVRKQTASDKEMHSDDITSLGISKCRTKVVTGQNGSRPVAFVWDSSSATKIQRFKLPKGKRAVKAAAISSDGTMVALVCHDNDHQVYCYNIDSEELIFSEKGGVDSIFDCYWS